MLEMGKLILLTNNRHIKDNNSSSVSLCQFQYNPVLVEVHLNYISVLNSITTQVTDQVNIEVIEITHCGLTTVDAQLIGTSGAAATAARAHLVKLDLSYNPIVTVDSGKWFSAYQYTFKTKY